MTPAHALTRTHVQSSVIAGAESHTIFRAGWFLLGMSLAALVATALFGNIIGSLIVVGALI